MVFQNFNQYKIAKEALINEAYDIDLAFNKIKDNKEFINLSKKELLNELKIINEGFGDNILNVLSKTFGGDINKIKKILNQMKEQELKFNTEEFEIFDKLYTIGKDKRALLKDKGPKARELNIELEQSKTALESRLRELNKTHNEIFDALELKVKDLVGDNKRKKRYFNIKRADDVLETSNDRYEKIKSVTSKVSDRSSELKDFLGVNIESIKKQIDDSIDNAEKVLKDIKRGKADETDDNAKEYLDELEKIVEDPGTFYFKRIDLNKLIKKLKEFFDSDNFSLYSNDEKRNMRIIYNKANNYLEQLIKDEKKINKKGYGENYN